jgi:hypothetical protein
MATIIAIPVPTKAHTQTGSGKKQYDHQDGCYLTENTKCSSLGKIAENGANNKYHTGYKKHAE